MPLRVWDELVAFADAHGLPLHLDGARVWNAAAALGVPPARVVRGATTVMVSLSKGLGCPVGSCLLGPHSLMEGARVVRRRLGGAMRQTGILAAAGLHALAHNLQRLADDHAHAALLAERLREHPVLRPVTPQTNIVVIDLEPTGITADAAVDRLAEQGVLLVALGDTTLRAVTHLDLARDDVAYAAEIIAVTLAS